MFDHISIGVANFAASARFYDAVLAALGYRRLADDPESIGYGDGEPAFWLQPSSRPVPADRENGLHICFKAPDRPSVDRFHAAGLAAGGADNGKPGERPAYGAGYYAAFIVDPDGYRIEAHFQA